MVDRQQAERHVGGGEQLERHLPAVAGPAAGADLGHMLLQPVSRKHVVERYPAARIQHREGAVEVAAHLMIEMQAIDEHHIEALSGVGREERVAGHTMRAALTRVDADLAARHHRVEQSVVRAADLQIGAVGIVGQQQVDHGLAVVVHCGPVVVEDAVVSAVTIAAGQNQLADYGVQAELLPWSRHRSNRSARPTRAGSLRRRGRAVVVRRGTKNAPWPGTDLVTSAIHGRSRRRRRLRLLRRVGVATNRCQKKRHPACRDSC